MGLTFTNHTGNARYNSGVPDLGSKLYNSMMGRERSRSIPPTEGIRVRYGRLNDKPSLGFQGLLNVLIRCLQWKLDMNIALKSYPGGTYLHVLPNKIWDLIGKFSGIVNWARGHFVRSEDTIDDRNTMIVFTECWGLMDDACTIGICDVGVGDDSERLVLELRACSNLVRKRHGERTMAPTRSVKYS